MNLKQRKLKLTILKAQAAIAELDIRILEREEDIGRMRDHIELQDANIKKAQEALNG